MLLSYEGAVAGFPVTCPATLPPSGLQGRHIPSNLLVPPMAEPVYANIGQLAARMSANHRRVVQSIDQMIAPIDEMVQASADGNWSKVAELGRQLSEESRKAGYRGIGVMAQIVANEATRPDNAHGVKRSLIRLIGTYGRTTRVQGAATSE